MFKKIIKGLVILFAVTVPLSLSAHVAVPLPLSPEERGTYWWQRGSEDFQKKPQRFEWEGASTPKEAEKGGDYRFTQKNARSNEWTDPSRKEQRVRLFESEDYRVDERREQHRNAPPINY